MAKGTLEFSLPEEQDDFNLAQDGVKYMLVLHELDDYLRGKIKYAPESQPDLVTDTFEQVREQLRQLVNDRGVEI